VSSADDGSEERKNDMTTRLRSANLEQEANFDEGVGELSVEEKYAEVKQLIIVGKEKGFLLYDEIYETLPEEITSLPEELDEIYIRFADLGIDVVEDSEKPLPTSSKAIVTIDGTIEEKEMDQREEVQQDIIAANSGIVDKTNDPVRMYLREMGTVKLLDRQGEVDIAKRIEKGERRVYKALSQNRIILEEILKIYESAKKDPRVIKEMIDLAMPEDESIAVQTDDNGEPKLPLAAVNKIADIMAIFEKVAKNDKKIKDAKAKLLKPEVDSRMESNLEFSNDVKGRIVCDMNSPKLFDSFLNIQGDAGELTVINPYHPHWFHWMTLRTAKNTWRGHIQGDNVYTLQLRAFASAIQSGTPLNTTANDAVKTMQVIDAIYEKAGLKLRAA